MTGEEEEKGGRRREARWTLLTRLEENFVSRCGLLKYDRWRCVLDG